MKTKKQLQILGMLAAGAASCMLFSGVSALAAENNYHRASDYIKYDSSGNPQCVINDRVQTGRFVIEPNYSLGDIARDGVINATDASSILAAAAKAGTGDSASRALVDMVDTCNSEETALLFADVNNDKQINAVDAAEIMSYAAEFGSGENILPLGSTYYYADENGILQKGFIQDGTSLYYADENYELTIGWLTVGGKQYYFSSEGICTPESWLKVENNTYYVLKDGSVAVGQQTIDGKIYNFDSQTGVLLSQSEEPVQTTQPPQTTSQPEETTTEAVQTTAEPETTQPPQTTSQPTVTETVQTTTQPVMTVQTGWFTENGKTYYLNESGQKSKGWLMVGDNIYYMDPVTGEALSGWQELSEKSFTISLPEGWKPDYDTIDSWTEEDWQKYYVYMGWSADGEPTEETANVKKFYYFSPENFTMQTGWLTLPEGKYYLDEDGTRHTGSLEYNGNYYGFDENGLMIVNQTTSSGKYDENGIYTPTITRDFDIDPEVRAMLDSAVLTPGIRHIDVKNRQSGLPYTVDPDLKNGINLTDRDYEIIEQFAAEHFTPDMTLSERLYVTWWWIHCNVDYAYNYTSAVWSLSYPDAVFNHKMGQCVQYNGAMAAVLAYYGFDVYMVRGWTRPESKSGQHYWTEVNINGKRYYVETGNQGKNGDHWQYFFEDAENVSYTKY